MGFPALGIPFMEGAPRRGESKGGNQGGGGAARDVLHSIRVYGDRQFFASTCKVSSPFCVSDSPLPFVTRQRRV